MSTESRRIHRVCTLVVFGVGALLILLAACAGGGRPAGEPLHTTQAGELSWRLWLDPNPPKQKGNALWVEVAGPDGKPLAGSAVESGYVMPAMGSMAEMRGQGDVVEEGPGLFRIGFDFPMSGTWTIPLRVTGPRGGAAAEYSLTVGSRGLRERGLEGDGGGPPSARSERQGRDSATTVALKLEPIELAPPVLEAMQGALAAYEEARLLLAEDRLDGLAARAGRLIGSLEAARQGLASGSGSPLDRCLAEAAAAAQQMASARDLPAARTSFGEASRFLIAVGAADRRLAEGWRVFHCPMTEAFPKWMQRAAEKKNPYLGRAMSGCGEESDWTVPVPATLAEAQAHADAAHGGEIAYYTCSMHPSVRSPEAGTCPLCSMDLVPVTKGEIASGTVRIDAARRQAIGVVTEVVKREPLTVPVRAVGKVRFDETKLTDVSVKYRGWIGRLYVDEPGQPVRRGETLFTLYSPELYAAQHEYLTALRSQDEARSTGAPDRADYLVAAARQRLRLWDLQPAQVDRLARTGEVVEEVPIASPASGYVVEKHVVAGGAIEPGMKLYRLAGLDTVWIEAEVYESELALIRQGDEALVTFPYLPGRTVIGTVAFVYPYLDPASRTGRVRVELRNAGLELKPEMYANVQLNKYLGERIAIPEEAVLYAGERSFVFVDLGDGRMRPQRVALGQTAGDRVEVLDGLRPGDVVVTSGNFLVAAESRLKLAMEQWR